MGARWHGSFSSAWAARHHRATGPGGDGCRVTSHLGSDAGATASVFAIFADEPWTPEQREFFPPLIHELAQQLAEFGMPIRGGWIVGPSSSRIPASYRGPEVPLQAVQSSCLNAEPVLRGSQIQDSPSLALPRPSPVGIHRRRPTPAIPDGGVGAFVSRHQRPPCPKPFVPSSDNAPEESWTTRAEEQAQGVI